MASVLSYAKVSRVHTLVMSAVHISCAYGYCKMSYPRSCYVWDYRAFVCVATAILLFHLATNTISEYRDCVMGVDDVHSPSTKYRLVTGIVPRGHVLVIGIASFAIASILGIIAVVSGNKMLLVPGLIGACISVSYSEKPLMLKYKPCGEVCVFLAYGPLLFASCILSLVGRVSAVDIVSSTPFGLMTAIILLANNIRDYGYDLGKSATLVTKLGLKRSWILLAAMAHVAYAIVIFLIYHGALPRSVAAVLVTYPLVIIALRRRRDPSMINILALLHVVFFLIITICIAL